MNIIEQLHQLVTPKVLELVKHYTGDDAVKTGLLSSIYGILGARLSDPLAVERVEELVSQEKDAHQNGSKLLDALLQDDKGNSQVSLLTSELAKEHNLPESTTSAVLATATPMVIEGFKGLAGERSLSAYLQDKLADFVDFLPSWATALLPMGLFAGIAGLAGSAISGAAGAVSGLASGVGSFAGKAASGVGSVASNVADGAKDVAGAVTGAVGGAVSGAKDAATSVASNVADGAKATAGVVTGAVGGAVSGAKDAASSVASGVGHVASNVGHGVTETAKKGGGFLKSLLPIIGLIILALLAWLLLRGCQDKNTPVAKPATDTGTTTKEAPATTAPADAKPATFSMATDAQGNAIYSCQSVAGGEGVFVSIRTALSGVFGVADKCEMSVTEGHADSLPAGEHLAGLFGLMKGVPNASINISDKTVRFNSTDPQALAKMIEGAKGILPADFVVEAEPKLDTATAVTNSIDSAKSAITELNENADADDLVRALNLQIINFASGKNDIPAANKEILDLAATKLTALPDAHLKITGHTDSQGNHAANKKLSERRAAAVRDYLTSKGVPAERLEVFGASSDEPVASNATEQGRFQNRRIEFTLVDKDGKVTSVGNAQNSQAAAKANANAPATTEAPKTEEAKPATDVAKPEEAKPAENK